MHEKGKRDRVKERAMLVLGGGRNLAGAPIVVSRQHVSDERNTQARDKAIPVTESVSDDVVRPTPRTPLPTIMN